MDVRAFRAVTRRLHDAGIGPQLKGYEYLRAAICLVIENPQYLDLGIHKRLYPDVAYDFRVTSRSVERDIRYAIRTAKENCPERFSDVAYFHNRTGNPTSAYVIAAIADAVFVELLTENDDPIRR